MAGDALATIYGDFATDFVEDRLSSLCDSNGGIQTGPFGSQLHQEDYVVFGTPIITVEHLGENRILHEGVPRVSDRDKNRLSRYLLRRGDIVFSRVGSVDRRALVREEEDGWLFSGRCLRVRPDPNKIDSGYLSYFFGLPSFKDHIRAVAVGATMPSLNTQLLSAVIIPHPCSLDEQRAIAHILGTLDAKIELNRRMNATLEAMARALFKSWFVDFDPVRAKMEGRDTGLPAQIARLFPDGFEESAVGEAPRGWKVGQVRDLGEVVCGKTPPTADRDNYNGHIPFITIPDMHGRVFVTHTSKTLSKKGAESQPSKTLPPFSICVSCIATPGLVAITSEPSQTNQQINSLVPSDRRSVYHCYYVLRGLADEIRTRGSGGSVVTNLNKGQFEILPVLIPTTLLQQTYHSLTDSLFVRLLANERESRTLAALRDTLLPKLISGAVRVGEAERFVA